MSFSVSHLPSRYFESILLLWWYGRSNSRLIDWHSQRHYRRSSAAGTHCKCTERCAVWHVPCDYHSAGTRKPHHSHCCNRKLRRQLRSSISAAVGTAYRRYAYYYPNCSHRSGCSLVQTGTIPAKGGLADGTQYLHLYCRNDTSYLRYPRAASYTHP